MSKFNNMPVIIDYVRTPFAKAVPPGTGRKPGQLANVTPVAMGSAVVKSLIERNDLAGKNILGNLENLVIGAVHQEAEQGLNIGRQIGLSMRQSGLPLTVQGDSVDKFCGSSARTISIAKNDIIAGEADLIIAGGVQSMSLIPMGGFNPFVTKEVYDGNPAAFMNMGVTAETLAKVYQISRLNQEEFAIQSHLKMAEAASKGYYKDEIVPLNGMSQDDNVRPNSDPAKLASLKPAFAANGTVTAATSSPITDGASAVLMASEAFAKANQLPVLANVLSYAGSGCEPETMGLGPVESSRKALQRAGLTMADMDVVELNEAFAAQALAVTAEWRKQGMEVPASKLNIDGGAIALGHPLAASGARLVGHAAKILQRTGKRYGLATMCIGGGQGAAVVIENPNYNKKAPSLTL